MNLFQVYKMTFFRWIKYSYAFKYDADSIYYDKFAWLNPNVHETDNLTPFNPPPIFSFNTVFFILFQKKSPPQTSLVNTTTLSIWFPFKKLRKIWLHVPYRYPWSLVMLAGPEVGDHITKRSPHL